MNKTLNKLIGDRIKAARTEKGLKQAEIAEKLGFDSPASISNIEQGVQNVQLIDIYKMAEIFDKDIYYFLPNLEELKSEITTIDKEKKKYPQKTVAIIEKIREVEIKKED